MRGEEGTTPLCLVLVRVCSSKKQRTVVTHRDVSVLQKSQVLETVVQSVLKSGRKSKNLAGPVRPGLAWLGQALQVSMVRADPNRAILTFFDIVLTFLQLY